jgi:hypothetical protein
LYILIFKLFNSNREDRRSRTEWYQALRELLLLFLLLYIYVTNTFVTLILWASMPSNHKHYINPLHYLTLSF